MFQRLAWPAGISSSQERSKGPSSGNIALDSMPVKLDSSDCALFARNTTHVARDQFVGWPLGGSYWKNTLSANATKTKSENKGRSEVGCCYVKVSMNGATYLRKVDLRSQDLT